MRLVQRFLIAVALVAAAIFVIPTPAQAGGNYMRVCFPVGETPWGTTIWDCYWIEVPVLGPKNPWPPECWVCDPQLDFWKDYVDPAVLHEFDALLGKGFGLLAESHLTKDEKLAEVLRAQATEVLLEAAAVVEKYPAELYRVGWVDVENGKEYFEPDPHPWLTGLGKELAEGTALMQQALNDPKNADLDKAMAHFDAAYENLAELAAV
ncbi:hypothetical protein [Glycomyces paridis]|uniref:Uncharacterized protein n=1 Tax=Glycomyces paridis TaxID=2126555 RepID=A0A4S8PGR9_9ACTN|nr:hypothetical protein [Glycomyces paridis]THV29101.1 hypothetical protein E9998_10185 [Glycomyces paridis]